MEPGPAWDASDGAQWKDVGMCSRVRSPEAGFGGAPTRLGTLWGYLLHQEPQGQAEDRQGTSTTTPS